MIKDKKIQIYYLKAIDGEKPVKYMKHYIYSQEIYNDGGLWANVRDLSTNESLQLSTVDRKLNIRFTVNFNPKVSENIKEGLYIEFKPIGAQAYNTYIVIGEADSFEYNANDIKLNAALRTVADGVTEAAGVEYED